MEASGNHNTEKPIRPFVYHHFHDYLAGLLSRPDLEQLLDKSCDNLMDSLSQTQPTFIRDVFRAEFLRMFKGPKPGTLFVDRQGSGHYTFSLNVDFFTIEGIRVWGANTLAGIISLACLNFPLNIHYKPENMYLGIIPPPNKPHLMEVNHYLRPLVNDISAVIAAGMDLLAAHKASGLAGLRSHCYCTVSQCFHQSTLGRTDFDNWVKRDNKLLQEHAEPWKNATTSTEHFRLPLVHTY